MFVQVFENNLAGKLDIESPLNFEVNLFRLVTSVHPKRVGDWTSMNKFIGTTLTVQSWSSKK